MLSRCVRRSSSAGLPRAPFNWLTIGAPTCVLQDHRGDLAVTEDTTAYRWADEHATRQLADEAYAIRVLDAIHSGNEPVTRAHNGGDSPASVNLKPGVRSSACLRSH